MPCKPDFDLPFSNLGRSFWKGEANLVFSGLQIEQVEGGHQQLVSSQGEALDLQRRMDHAQGIHEK